MNQLSIIAALMAAVAVGYTVGSNHRFGRRLDRITDNLIEYWSRREDVEGGPATEAKEDIQ